MLPALLIITCTMSWLRWYDYYGDSSDDEDKKDSHKKEELPVARRKKKHRHRTIKCIREERVITRSISKTFEYS